MNVKNPLLILTMRSLEESRNLVLESYNEDGSIKDLMLSAPVLIVIDGFDTLIVKRQLKATSYEKLSEMVMGLQIGTAILRPE